jgi:hypothetical protein
MLASVRDAVRLVLEPLDDLLANKPGKLRGAQRRAVEIAQRRLKKLSHIAEESISQNMADKK